MEITRKGIATSVEGVQPKVGDNAPQFNLPNIEGSFSNNETYKGKKTIISVFPDINTRVCDLQTRRFFQIAGELTDVNIVNVSNNTVEQLNDWCAVAGIKVDMLSDTDLSFAKAFGLYIPEFDVLARSIFVLDEEGTVIYEEIVPEMSSEPDYETALNHVR